MKKENIRKVIIGVFSFMLIFMAGQTLASSTWNNAPNDCPTVAVANFTTNTGYVNPCWPLSSVNANPGDSVNVRIYYHNTSSQNATNVRIVLNASSGSSSNHSFSGQIISDQGSVSFGPVSINTPSNSTLTLGGTHWLPNQTQSDSSFLYGQNGSEVLAGGLNIGTITPSWSSQGSVVVAFSVSSSINPPSNMSGTLTPANTSCIISSGSSNCSLNFYWHTINPVGISAITRDGNGTVATGNSGTKALTVPYGSTTFRLYNNAIDLADSSVSSSCTSGTSWNGSSCIPNVNPIYNCSISNFTANQNYIKSGEPVTINWNTSNCTSVNISNIGRVYNSGSQTIYPNISTNYILNAYGQDGKVQTRSLYVTVANNHYPVYPPRYNTCSILNFTANPTHVTSSKPVTLSWNTNGCNSTNITGIGSVTTSGSRIVYPTASTNYILSASNYNQPAQFKTSSVIVSNFKPAPTYNSCTATTVATNITQTSATLNGLITNFDGTPITTYFEYGPRISLGLKTRSNSYTKNTSFSKNITGLKPGSIYYFRANSNCQNASERGTIEVFKTLNSHIVRPIIIQGKTIIGTQSPIMLKIENHYQSIGPGDVIEYTVTYKNIGKSTLIDPILQVIVPKGMNITNTSKGTYSEDTKTLTAKLNNLKSGESGNLYVQGQVKSVPQNTAQIVTTALLVYTNTNKAQENAIAYVLNTPKETNNSLGAAALFGGFTRVGLIGWLLIIILILLIILIIHKYFYRPLSIATRHTNSK